MKGTRVNPDGSIIFCYNHYSASSVQVAGSFSNWTPLNLQKGSEGWWFLRTEALNPGDYEYLFVVDGDWTGDQFNMLKSCQNSIINVGGQKGSLLRNSFFSHALGKEKRFSIYLPPSYFYNKEESYPVLYIMAGLLDDDSDWSRKGKIEKAADELINSGRIGEMIIVCPDKDSLAENPQVHSEFGIFLARDIVNHIENHFRAVPDSRFRAIDGLSLGAAWSIKCGTSLPGHYSSVGAMSGGFTEESIQSLNANAEAFREFGTRFRIMVGNQEDELVTNNSQASEFIQNLGIYCEFYVKEGIHDWPIWCDDIYGALQFHFHSFQI